MHPSPRRNTGLPARTTVVQNEYPTDVDPSVERRAGRLPTIEFLRHVHEVLRPRSYLEVGVETGASLRLASCPAIGIDPVPELTEPLASNQSIAYALSDDFFASGDLDEALCPLDLVYIDGMHLIEQVVSDFVNVEAYCAAGSVILVDDIFPNHPIQGCRTRSSRHWTGDVWKVLAILESRRPDLLTIRVDTEPTGTLIVLGTDPQNRILRDAYDALIGPAVLSAAEPPAEVLERHGSFDPNDPILGALLRRTSRWRTANEPASVRRMQREILLGAMPRRVVMS